MAATGAPVELVDGAAAARPSCAGAPEVGSGHCTNAGEIGWRAVGEDTNGCVAVAVTGEPGGADAGSC